MSPMWLMMTRCPVLLYRHRNLGARATASCMALGRTYAECMAASAHPVAGPLVIKLLKYTYAMPRGISVMTGRTDKASLIFATIALQSRAYSVKTSGMQGPIETCILGESVGFQ